MRNGCLQGAYFIVAARALGLDCGPMSGFDSALADEAFFAGTRVKSFMLVNLGHGDPSKVYARGPRFEFDEVCRIDFETTMTMVLTVTARSLDQGEIPRRYTCEGDDCSPPLSWSGVPAGTGSLALIVTTPTHPIQRRRR